MTTQRFILSLGASALMLSGPAFAAPDPVVVPPGPQGYLAIGFVLFLAVALLLVWLLEDSGERDPGQESGQPRVLSERERGDDGDVAARQRGWLDADPGHDGERDGKRHAA